jgi:hypothetical protein
MSKYMVHNESMFFHPSKEEQKTVPINLKVKPSQEKRWKEMIERFGIKDLSTFIRGAVESAIFNSLRAEDPEWQKFIEAIQPTALKILGHGFYDGGASDFEASGTDRKGTPANDFLAELEQDTSGKKVDSTKTIENKDQVIQKQNTRERIGVITRNIGVHKTSWKLHRGQHSRVNRKHATKHRANA